MNKYCCDKMQCVINRKGIRVDKDGYYFVYDGKAEGHTIDVFEDIYYCPFCGKSLEGEIK